MATAPQEPELPARGRFRLAAAALKSSLRRYPPELVASLRERPGGSERALRDLLAELAPHGLASCWLGHASVVATMGNLTVAVDPVLSNRIGLKWGRKTLGLERLSPAPFGAESLRGIDAVLITHAHFDHLDRPTLAAMADHRTTVVVPPQCGRLIPPGFGRVIEVAPGGRIELGDASLEALAPRHWGARTWFDRGRGVCAYEVRHPEGSVLFAGDTAHTRAFDGRGDVDLAVFGIGAYEPWEHMHATPEQVWQMFSSMRARYLLPVHHSTFELSDEPVDEPLRRLMAAARGESHRIVTESIGEVVAITTGSG